jgi:hypothetical protein
MSKMTLNRRQHFKTLARRGDGYDEHGYTGYVYQYVEVPSQPDEFIPVFTWEGSPTNP